MDSAHVSWAWPALIALVAVVFFALKAAMPAAPSSSPSRWRIVRPGRSDEPVATGWEVRLESAGSAPINVLKSLRETCALNLAAAKQLVDEAPSTVSTHDLKASAEHVAERLRQAGATVAIVEAGSRGERVEVRLESPGDQPIFTIRLVREVSGHGLKESKELVESAPTLVKVCHGEDEVDAVRRALKASGAAVEES